MSGRGSDCANFLRAPSSAKIYIENGPRGMRLEMPKVALPPSVSRTIPDIVVLERGIVGPQCELRGLQDNPVTVLQGPAGKLVVRTQWHAAHAYGMWDWHAIMIGWRLLRPLSIIITCSAHECVGDVLTNMRPFIALVWAGRGRAHRGELSHTPTGLTARTLVSEFISIKVLSPPKITSSMSSRHTSTQI